MVLCASCFSSSRCLSSVHPVAMTSNPPPTCTTGSEIPKKARMYVPIKYDPTSKKKLFMAMRHDNSFRASGAYCLVSARKKGLPPSGSTIGKSALKTRNRLFAASSIDSSLIYLDLCAIESRVTERTRMARKTGSTQASGQRHCGPSNYDPRRGCCGYASSLLPDDPVERWRECSRQ